MSRSRLRVLCLALCFAALPAGLADTPPARATETLVKRDVTLSPLETRVLGQRRWLRGGPAALRVVVSDHRSGLPARARVSLSLVRLDDGKPAGTPLPLFSGRTTPLGTLDARFRAPAGAAGPYRLTVSVSSPLGADEVTQPIDVAEATQILLTADKPVYQPGQTIHLRALALDMGTRRAVAEESLVFEAEDARGNKVFKQRRTLSPFGVASADFVLADEVNMGTFALRAVLPEGQTEKKVRVERYVLPKFKVALTTDRPYYLPGETVHGTVQAHYFFGKPVAGGQVTVAVNTVDIGVTELGMVNGTTDAEGSYPFQYTLPDSFVGQPFEQGRAVVEFAGTLKDTADHAQEVHVTVPVVKDPILLAVVPESRGLVAGVQNRVYIAAATPDGQPLRRALLRVSDGGAAPTVLATDDLGLATYSFVPGNGPVVLSVQATDADGHVATTLQQLAAAPAEEGVLLRVDKPLAKVGDRLTLAAVSTVKTGTLYIDVIRDGQTILTQATDMQNGAAQVPLNVTPDMVGTLEIHAYKILPNEDIVRDTRTVIVSPADDLSVRVAADRGVYGPGTDATLRFAVHDQKGSPVSTALGVAIVDESVFALSELKPGLEKIYFTLEKELMEPKYEIHGLSPTGLMEPAQVKAPEPARQRAAAMLLAAVPPRTDFDFQVNTYQARWEKVKAQVAEAMARTHQRIAQALGKYRADTSQALAAGQPLYLLAERGYLHEADLRDPWGRPYKAELYGRTDYDGYWTLSSAGPDGLWGTADDINERPQPPMMRFRALGAVAGGGFGGFGGGGGGFPGGAADEVHGRAANSMGVVLAGAVDAGLFSKTAAIGGEPPRVRQFFPETLYWNPALITDANGQAEARVPLADSITTWRVSTLGSSAAGQLGSGDAPIKVFQDFFVDLDLPVALTQGDSVQIPVSVYNYLPQAQDVTLTLDPQPWFTLQGPSRQVTHVGPNQVTVVYYPLTVNTIGHFPLTVTARGTSLSDAVRRTIDVLPNGKEVRTSVNDRLDGSADTVVTIPADAVAGASTVWVKLYPGTFSQVVDGLDGLLQMPNGCFEQTSSTTYPDVLILDYLKQTKHINPELQMKAEGYINVGYQRLVTFETPGGGFSWFGSAPAHQILTAYGLLEFGDMAKVHDVDPALITRTQQWLAGRQKADGTWEETGQGIAEGIINRQTGALRTTAYVAWALAESGYSGPEVARGVDYVKAHLGEAKDPYTLAVILNLLTQAEPGGDAAAQAANGLIALATQTDKTAYWKSDTQTFTGAEGQGADLETTGLAAYGLVRWGRNAGFVSKALTYLVQSKNSFGVWGSTQGTVWSLKALLSASGNALGGGNGTVTVLANGQTAATFALTPEDSDVMRQADLAKFVHGGDNQIGLRYQGEGAPLYQIVGRYYLPWDKVPSGPEAIAPLSIRVAYDKTTLAQDDTATVTATVRNNTDKTAEMPLIDLGLPPGFTPLTDALDAAVQGGTISKYTVAARQIIVYMEKLEAGRTVTLTYQIKAKYPIKTRTSLSRVYPYYNPERVATAAPQALTVSASHP
ncbi:MAG: hypothetical protein JO250_06755 [Armatimonadetes bacterium]|nr:hypothetical protein [Armatimonadota bacterium]